MLRAAGADLVLLLASLHDPDALARLVERAREIGLEPLVEAHDAAEVEAAVASGARIVGLNNRDLRTLEVDPEIGVAVARARPGRPARRRRVRCSRAAADRPLACPGLRCGAGRRGLRPGGGPGGHRPFVRRGRSPAGRSRQRRAAPVREDLRDHRRGRCPRGRSRRRRRHRPQLRARARHGPCRSREAADLARLVRAAGRPATRPRIVAITVDATADELAAIGAAVDPDAIQLNGSESVGPGGARSGARSGRSSTCRPRRPATAIARPPRDGLPVAGPTWTAGATRLLLDTAGGPHPGGTGVRAAEALAAARRPRAPRDAGRRPRSGQRGRRPPRHRGDRRGRRIGRRGPA